MGPDVLVADIGGTNTRLSLAGPGGWLHGTSRFANDEHAGFDVVLERFLSAHPGPVAACCVAVAGPITPERARLTNRDWTIERAAVAERLGGVPVRLVNDLAALGHALPGLSGDQIEELRPGAPGPRNGQALVAGLGTGFNVCLAKVTTAGQVVVEAELGHSSLPVSVHRGLAEALGKGAEAFPTVEHLFSGRGLSELHRALTGAADRPAHEIVASAPATVKLAAHLTGLLARQLVFQYMPLDGIRFAGSVGRGILGPIGRAAFLRAVETEDGAFSHIVDRVPLGLITDDAAALTGLARLALTLAQG
ncbi:glucokinase [Seohaeicola zhoushanensis]|uniref:Glucokinase n=1 Tax=Seohaeicola zhoushanensis TaxID=1569283 RepID=A0A8J3H282_9RHOB|nr:glucokinase [Seohaeicola zhoushanensis]GHF66792.1 glucokinase [Seohaeicola zhoushanensis]